MSLQTDTLNAYAKALNDSIRAQGIVYRLADSSLLKNTIARVTDPTITIRTFDYYKWVQSGSPKGSLRGVNIPISVLQTWALSKGIPVEAVWAIQRAIFKNGRATPIEPRRFLDDAIDAANELFEAQFAIQIETYLTT